MRLALAYIVGVLAMFGFSAAILAAVARGARDFALHYDNERREGER